LPSRLIATLLLLACLLAYIAEARPSHAQQISSETPSKPAPLCDPAVIDTIYSFLDQPAGQQTISLHFLNTGSVTCRLKELPGPSFAVDGHSMHVKEIRDQKPEYQVTLAPGATAAIDIHWGSTGDSCQFADWVSFFFNWSETYEPGKLTDFLFVPSAWPLHICSPVKSSNYRIEADSPFSAEQKEPVLQVSLLQKAVYSDERANLRVVLTKLPQPHSTAPSEPTDKPLRCSSLYTVRHTAPQGTRLDPLHMVDMSYVASFTPEQVREDKERAWPSWRKASHRECDVPDGILSGDAQIDASDLATVTHIEWRTAPSPGKDPAFFTAATHFTVLDVETLAPNWGDTVQGIRAGLSVDREKFGVGERVPLRTRWQNVNASVPIGQTECRGPLPDLEVQDSDHKVLKTLPSYEFCSGHGWGPFAINNGLAQHEFRELTTSSPASAPSAPVIPPILPGPGVYYLVTVWSPRVLDTSGPESNTVGIGNGRLAGVYATVRSAPVRIEVVSSNKP
jgi:hypothetical protein